MFFKDRPDKLKQEDGFTLIDLSIILVVAALLLVPIARQIEIEYRDRKYGNTLASQSEVKAGLKQYFDIYDNFPCPADPTLGPGDADHGLADCSITGDPMVGAVPFKNLKIPVESSLDGYGHKMTYAISLNLTSAGSFTPTGSITTTAMEKKFRDVTETYTDPETGQTSQRIVRQYYFEPETHADNIYALISHGPNGIGVYTANGSLVAACSGTARETENCDGDDEFIEHRYYQSSVQDDNSFDDYVTVLSGLNGLETWRSSDADANDVYSSRNVLIGIGTEEPRSPLDVAGNIRTQEGNTEAGVFCVSKLTEDPSLEPNDCFKADIIGGVGINCGNGVMTGIKYGNADCNIAVTVFSGQCSGANQYVTGIDESGEVICGP